MKKAVLFSLLIAFLAGCQTVSNSRNGPIARLSDSTPLTDMCFNIRVGYGWDNFGVSPYDLEWGRNLPAVAAAIRSADPDIVGLQEVAGSGQAERLAEMLNMNYAFTWHDSSGAHQWWGVAVLSKFPIVAAKGASMSSTRNFLITEVDTGIGKISIVNIHKDPRLYDGSSLRRLRSEIAAIRTPILLMGDFNIRAGTGLLDEIEADFADSAKAVETAASKQLRRLGTFWDGRRIDYIFAERRYFSVEESGLVSKEHWKSSDHHAFYAKIRVKAHLLN